MIVGWCRCGFNKGAVVYESEPILCGCGAHVIDFLWDCTIHYPLAESGRDFMEWTHSEGTKHWRLTCLLRHYSIDTRKILIKGLRRY